MSAKGNPKFSCPPINFPSNNNSLVEHSDSREKLFDSSPKTVNVSVNTELLMDFSYGPKEEDFDVLHFYGEMDNDVFHKMMSADDLTYSTLFSDEVFGNGEWHTYAGLKTCNVMKSTRHGNELGMSIQSATERGDSGIDNIAYLSGDDTGCNGHTQVYESSNNMLVGNSISEDQIESDMDLEDGFCFDDEIYSDSDDGDYLLADESLEETLYSGSLKSCPCTVVSSQAVSELDPSADLLSLEVPDPSDKWEDDDFGFCVFDEHLLFAKSPDCDNAASFCSIVTGCCYVNLTSLMVSDVFLMILLKQ